MRKMSQYMVKNEIELRHHWVKLVTHYSPEDIGYDEPGKDRKSTQEEADRAMAFADAVIEGFKKRFGES